MLLSFLSLLRLSLLTFLLSSFGLSLLPFVHPSFLSSSFLLVLFLPSCPLPSVYFLFSMTFHFGGWKFVVPILQIFGIPWALQTKQSTHTKRSLWVWVFRNIIYYIYIELVVMYRDRERERAKKKLCICTYLYSGLHLTGQPRWWPWWDGWSGARRPPRSSKLRIQNGPMMSDIIWCPMVSIILKYI